MENSEFMLEAIAEAEKALSKNEVPIGCVIVFENEIIGRGHNLRNTLKNPLMHGEIIAINEAAKAIGDWRLENCDIYVTIEPCPMCAGAIVTARMKRLIFGARNEKAGCCGSILDIVREDRFNHMLEVTEGVMQEECAGLMRSFFKKLRNP